MLESEEKIIEWYTEQRMTPIDSSSTMDATIGEKIGEDFEENELLQAMPNSEDTTGRI